MQIKLSAIITKKNFADAILKAFLLPDKKGRRRLSKSFPQLWRRLGGKSNWPHQQEWKLNLLFNQPKLIALKIKYLKL